MQGNVCFTIFSNIFINQLVNQFAMINNQRKET
jgi:hypothetical protein